MIGEPLEGQAFAVCSTMLGWRNGALIGETPNQQTGRIAETWTRWRNWFGFDWGSACCNNRGL